MSGILYFSIFISYRFIYYPHWHRFLFIQHGCNHYSQIHCTYVNRPLICAMSQVFMFCFLTCSYSLIKNPSTSPTYNGGFWPVEFKPFCLYSWCFLAQLAEISCLFDALSVHTNVPLDNGSQLIHSFLWHTHSQCNLYNSWRYGDWGPVTTETTQCHTLSPVLLITRDLTHSPADFWLYIGTFFLNRAIYTYKIICCWILICSICPWLSHCIKVIAIFMKHLFAVWKLKTFF